MTDKRFERGQRVFDRYRNCGATIIENAGHRGWLVHYDNTPTPMHVGGSCLSESAPGEPPAPDAADLRFERLDRPAPVKALSAGTLEVNTASTPVKTVPPMLNSCPPGFVPRITTAKSKLNQSNTNFVLHFPNNRSEPYGVVGQFSIVMVRERYIAELQKRHRIGVAVDDVHLPPSEETMLADGDAATTPVVQATPPAVVPAAVEEVDTGCVSCNNKLPFMDEDGAARYHHHVPKRHASGIPCTAEQAPAEPERAPETEVKPPRPHRSTGVQPESQERVVLRSIISHPGTSKDIVERLPGLTPAKASAYLSSLKSKGLIEMAGLAEKTGSGRSLMTWRAVMPAGEGQPAQAAVSGEVSLSIPAVEEPIVEDVLDDIDETEVRLGLNYEKVDGGLKIIFSESIKCLVAKVGGARKLAAVLLERADELDPPKTDPAVIEAAIMPFELPAGAIAAFYPAPAKQIAAAAAAVEAKSTTGLVSPIEEDGPYLDEFLNCSVLFWRRTTEEHARDEAAARLSDIGGDMDAWRKAKQVVDARVEKFWGEFTDHDQELSNSLDPNDDLMLQALWCEMHALAVELMKSPK